MSDLDESEVNTVASLERQKRLVTRSIHGVSREVTKLLAENPSFELTHLIRSNLDVWSCDLARLNSLNGELLGFIDATKLSTPEARAKAEGEVCDSFFASQHEFISAKGKLNSMATNLDKNERASLALEAATRQSLNSTLQQVDPGVANPLVKLPDIKVPKFDGKLSNFTEWYALFVAMIDSNESLKPVQKLYFLKNALIDNAATLLKDYPLTEGMYDNAFQYVKDRYYNKRAIIGEHFRDLLDFPTVQVSTLRSALDKWNAIVRGLNTCGLDTAKMSPLLTYIAARKIPASLRADWENGITDHSTYPSFTSLTTFLQNRCFAHETMHSEAPEKSNSAKPVHRDNKKKASFVALGGPVKDAASTSTSTVSCVNCKQSHFLSQCENFRNKSLSDRLSFVREKKLCGNCLRPGHTAAECNSSKCRKCGGNHHTLLHREVMPDSSNPESSAPKASAAAVLTRTVDLVMLPSAVVFVRIRSGLIKARVLIDPCSQVNLVTEGFIRQHRLATRSALSTIQGVAPGEISSSYSVLLKLKSRHSSYELELEANVVGQVPYTISSKTLKKIQDLDPSLKLADCLLPYSTVDILIGGQHAHQILLGKRIFFGEFALEESRFGWVAEGPLDASTKVDTRYCNLTVKVEDEITKFFEIEEVYPPHPTLGQHEQCEAHFLSSHRRLENGRFQVKLPRAKPISSLANTYRQARAALFRFERSLDAPTRSMYVDFMKEYRELNHMRLATNLDVTRYFIPHLFVLRPDSTSTKFRTVFNASAKNQSGTSLNEALMVGPTLQPDLFDIILRFRTYRVAFAADISKMYRQIDVHPDDWPLQSILWRDCESEPVQIYELTTVTYGTAPASYIATKCLQVLAEEMKSTQPEVSFAISSEFYMDDLLTGAQTVDAAIAKRQLIQSTLDGAHFPLRKYVSNSPEFLESLDAALIESLQPIEFTSSAATKLLGLQWQPSEDWFSIKAKPPDLTNVVLTKRIVASLSAQAFDPMGFVAPVIVRAKILLQDLWREGKGWDEPIAVELANAFREYHRDIASLPALTIPRFYSAPSGELVGFCDASPRAYGAAVYLRVHRGSDTRSVLVCAKTKVAPLKAITIPRLELLGAVLLAKLLQRVCKVLKCAVESTAAFCDSTIVLAWLKGPSSKYETFVRNRAEFINSILPHHLWQYVNTAENPADLLTRGVNVKTLANNSLWFNGPSWLTSPTLRSTSIDLPEDVPETRKACHVTAAEPAYDESVITRYSDFDKSIRIASRLWQFVSRLKPEMTKYNDLHAYTRGLYVLCGVSQRVSFLSELRALQNGEPLPPKSSLAALNPFLDPFGLLRVGGRLRNSNLSYDAQYPIILSRRSSLPELMIRRIHEKYFHAYRSFTLAFLQSRFWIVGGAAQLVKKVLHQCVWCIRAKGDTLKQIMGDLPRERSSVSRPFSCVGVDFAGPFQIRCTNHRTYKILKYYAAFFVCFSTRAVHLEHVSDLSTNAFIAALQRFSARRGIPHTIWSDNATNFLGTKNALEQHCTSLGITWKFIPARSPHHGGLWEAAVKSGKKHLVAAINTNVLTAEQFITALAVVESILNSRPLYRKRETANPDSIDILTPGHFLVGSHLLHVPSADTHSGLLSERLEIQHRIVCSFWRLWSKSYLAQLQSRSKWKRDHPNLAVGDVVLIKEEQLPPLKWRLARVARLLPDSLGKVRVAEVASNGSTYTRSIQKLVKLPVEVQ